MKRAFFTMALLGWATIGHTQTSDIAGRKPKEIVFLAGTIQPMLLQGWNFEVDFYLPRMVFNYSHGFSLDMESSIGTTVGEAKRQSVAYHLPYSTGFGVGIG